VGWSVARVYPLPTRRLQCFKRLETGQRVGASGQGVPGAGAPMSDLYGLGAARVASDGHPLRLAQ
jgi:hypothetical protein